MRRPQPSSSPAYVNVLSIFAMCNTHDLTWGTKADNDGPDEDLGSVKGSGKEVEIMLPTVSPDHLAIFVP